jgi:hypothetical protein
VPLKNLFLYGFLWACRCAFPQSDTLHLYQAYPSFSNEQKAEWTAFENNWQFYQYPKLQSKLGLKKLSCKDCESFYADIYLEIDDAGKISKAGVITGRACGKSLGAVASQDFIKSLEGPFRFIRNKAFIARFGHVLKC